MLKHLTKTILLTFSMSVIFLTSCGEDDNVQPELLAGFSSETLGLANDEDQTSVTLELSRVAGSVVTIVLTIDHEEGVVYGTDYSTEPALIDGNIIIEIPEGSTSAPLLINKLKDLEFGEVKTFEMSIESITNNGFEGKNKSIAVTFEENPTSSGTTIAPSVGGSVQSNQVFIDLSRQTETVVDKDTWDLAFSSGDDFRVILNYAAYTMARPTDQTDLAMITDVLVTDDYKNEMVDFIANTEFKDAVDGDLTKTAIAEISAADDDNLVYVINRGVLDDEAATERGFKKVKITQSEGDYVITYGDISDADGFTSVTISKSMTHDFTYFSFDTNGEVSVAPAADSWDFQMTTFFNEFDTGEEILSFKFKDFSLTNHTNMKIASVDGDADAYSDFTSADLGDVTLENNRLGIGSSWRLFDFVTNLFTINSGIFYIIEDVDGNTYKLRFTKMLNDQGERGNPEFTYELLN